MNFLLSISRPVLSQRVIRSFLIGVGLFGGAALFPAASFCIFQRLFQVPCPACGGTRSVLALLQLQWVDSFRWNPGLWVGSLLFLLVLLLFRSRQNKVLLATTTFLVAGFGVGLVRIFASLYWKHSSLFRLDF